jgi:uncharacterized protein (DUF111 family)
MLVPAPATKLPLKGFELFDDGIDRERVTPTTAILHYRARTCRNRPAPTNG